MATCARCGTIMPGFPGSKCPSCGAISNPKAPEPQAPPEAEVQSAKVPATPQPARSDRAMPGPLEKTALGLNLIMYGVLVFVVTLILSSLLGKLTGMLNLVSFLLLVGGVVLVGLGLGFTVLPIVVAVLLMFIPLINLVVLLMVAARAVKALKAAGWRIGFMGAKRPAA